MVTLNSCLIWQIILSFSWTNMVVYTLKQRWKILWHYFESHGKYCRMCVKIAYGFWKKRSTVSSYLKLGNIATFFLMVMLQNVCENCVRILEEGKQRQLRMFIILWKKWKKLAFSSLNQSVKSQKQCVHPRKLLLWQKVCVKRHQHQFTIIFNN